MTITIPVLMFVDFFQASPFSVSHLTSENSHVVLINFQGISTQLFCISRFFNLEYFFVCMHGYQINKFKRIL